MGEQVEKRLRLFKKMTITVDELEAFFPARVSYDEFAGKVLELERAGLLQMVKAKGRNRRIPSLAHQYRIDKHLLQRDHYKQLQSYRLKFHHHLDLDNYFTLTPDQWEEDLPYLEKINSYIENHPLPTEFVAAPERSFQLVGDEKWVEYKKGKELLQRIHLWEKLKIIPVSDPLMFALNPAQLMNQTQYHLIVENKTTYNALLPVLPESAFATVMYGVGNKIVKSIENFPFQYPVQAEHCFLYFGDIDYSGISIWQRLSNKIPAIPAHAFYRACLEKASVHGKGNQTPNKKALQTFLTHFTEKEQQLITQTLDQTAYFPQEILITDELQRLMLETNWQLYSKKEVDK